MNAKRCKIKDAPSRDIPVYMELEIGIPTKNKKKWGKLHTGRPDLDNVLKAVKDAIVNAGILDDDSQISAGDTVKYYSEHPGIIRLRLSVMN